MPTAPSPAGLPGRADSPASALNVAMDKPPRTLPVNRAPVGGLSSQATAPAGSETACPTSAVSTHCDLAILVTAALCLIALAVLLVFHVRGPEHDPYRSPQLAALKQQLLDQPKNEELKNADPRPRPSAPPAIRPASWPSTTSAPGSCSPARCSSWSWPSSPPGFVPRLPAPQAATDAAERASTVARQARRTAAVAGAATRPLVFLIGWPAEASLPANPSEVDQSFLAQLRGEVTDQPAALPSPAEYAANWPRFLGPTANAFASNATLALAVRPGQRRRHPLENARARRPASTRRSSGATASFSPAATLPTAASSASTCATGAPLWQRAVANVPGSPPKPPEIPESTGFAAPTMATDGLRVYAIFANGDLAAFTLDGTPRLVEEPRRAGQPLRARHLPRDLAGPRDRAVRPGRCGGQQVSKLIALDGATGRVAWQTPRPVGASWASPVVAEAAGKPQIVALAGELGHRLPRRATAAELWRAELLSGEITPSPDLRRRPVPRRQPVRHPLRDPPRRHRRRHQDPRARGRRTRTSPTSPAR